jgi:hypothetical protein
MRFKNRVVFTLVFILSSSFAKLIAQQPAQPAKEFKLFFEKVYLHIDRSYYATGDDIWFKAYLVNAQNNLLVNTSNNLYVELIDPAATIISREVVRLDNGIGVGDFKLADSIPGGAYHIRAYTNWMRNFGNHFVYEKEIQVSNIKGVSKSNVSTSKANAVESMAVTSANKIQFLPEGGSMVQGLSTVVSFKVEDAKGNGIDARGSIVSAKGDTIVRFATTRLGMGSFAFKPEANTEYRAWVRFKNGALTAAQFPLISPEGYVMNVTEANAEKVVVSISANEKTAGVHPGGEVTIAAKHAGKIYYKEKITLKDGKGTVTVPKKDFPTGIASITLYDEELRPNCERLVYIENDTLSIAVATDKPAYQPKDAVTVNIAVTDAQSQPVKASLSLSAVDDNLDKEAPGNIASYLLLESELTGKVENPSGYFDKNNLQRFEQLDLLLRTQGWRNFLWRQMADTNFRISYLPEPGVTISGKVREKFANKPLQDMNITLYAAGAKGNKWYSTRTDASGRYFLDGLPLYGYQTVKISSKNDKGKGGGLLLMDTVFNNPLPAYQNPFYTTDTSAMIAYFKQERVKRDALAKNFGWQNILPGVTVTSRPRSVVLRDGNAYTSFGYPEYDFNVTSQDYNQSVRDFLVKKVPGAQYDVESDGVNFPASGKPVRPRFVVDKREDVFERLDYYAVPMNQVERISVRHYVGHPTFTRSETNGRLDLGNSITDVFVVYLTLKPGAYNTDVAVINTEISGYYEARLFYSPNYTSLPKTNPDVRTTIHWQPLITTDENGKASVTFYNADPKTTIRVNVQGVSDKGVPVVASTRYEVK